MSDPNYIGWWAMRRRGKWHLVESEVTDRLVMRCGRQMRMEATEGVLSFAVQPGGEGCEQCVGKIVRD
jgi:hypothetical protein